MNDTPLTFRHALEQLINRHSMEQFSNTPDWILAAYLEGCLAAFDRAVRARETWYGRKPVKFPDLVNPKETP
jgi:hypothetical protein